MLLLMSLFLKFFVFFCCTMFISLLQKTRNKMRYNAFDAFFKISMILASSLKYKTKEFKVLFDKMISINLLNVMIHPQFE